MVVTKAVTAWGARGCACAPAPAARRARAPVCTRIATKMTAGVEDGDAPGDSDAVGVLMDVRVGDGVGV